MILTESHMALLRLIGPKGATREKLGEYAASHELRELVGQEYARSELTELLKPTPGGGKMVAMLWCLTPSGALAIGIDPDRIGLA